MQFMEPKYKYYARDNFGPIIVPENHMMALGDNRDGSEDSRYWGPVPFDNITGRPTFIYLSTDLVDELTPQEKRSLTMVGNIKLMMMSIVKFWHIRFDRMFRILI